MKGKVKRFPDETARQIVLGSDLISQIPIEFSRNERVIEKPKTNCINSEGVTERFMI